MIDYKFDKFLFGYFGDFVGVDYLVVVEYCVVVGDMEDFVEFVVDE